ncbi:Exosome complex component CSL4 [Carpediemonas membranifera]|uniref:Exosome complex component CSL4 n=1 Tax=Carpediemonas membranifera TaxID=201153 RepID=A0A8J6AU88_9EUKA|nr:Exosome complex component CSL4 [Carpediemonas membranifera]|eukprot:KAG9391710.1 Exosome complex component CSL4 [Carpediemonas membranifera]
MPTVVPGSFLCQIDPSSEKTIGDNVFEMDGLAFSSVVGEFKEDSSEIGVQGHTVAVPAVKSTVIGRVVRISKLSAFIILLFSDGQRLTTPFRGILRSIDVRDYKVDDVSIEQFFRPGDIVKATVLGLGDGRSLLLTTAGPGLGLIHSRRPGAMEMAEKHG